MAVRKYFQRPLHRFRDYNRTGTGKAVTIGVLILLAAIGFGAKWAVQRFLFPPLPESVKIFAALRVNPQWSEDQRQWYYHASQGSQVMPYDWFLALEQPDSNELFIDPDHMSRMRFIPDPNPKSNPDLLPIGFAKDDPDPVTAVVNVGLTCAACHTALITYRGMGLHVDGAPGLFNFDQFLQRLVLAVGITVQPNFTARLFESEPTKFTRFARRVLKDKYSEAAAAQLKDEVRAWLREKVIQQAQQFGRDNASHEQPTAGGFGRLDALGNGGNRVYRTITPDNLRVLNAPVAALPVWYVGQYDWVQTNGAIRQPMARNIIEALAVNASLVIPGPKDLYVSSVRMKNMFEMEQMIGALQAPRWPEEILGRIDHAKADAGKALYQKHCSSCHSPQIEPAPLCADEIAVRNKTRYFILRVYPFDQIGTDPLDANNFATRTVDASRLPPLTSNEPGPKVIQTVIGGVLDRGFKELNLPQPQEDEWKGYRNDLWRAPKGYPARPLDGIWATPPFLHNNSVPNLYELLLPADKRSKKFYTGSTEYDPKNVGYSTEGIKGAFHLDVSLPGNSNAGHEFRNAPAGTKGVLGPELSDAERWQLVEYLKIIDEFPAARAAAVAQPESSWPSPCWTPPPNPAW